MIIKNTPQIGNPVLREIAKKIEDISFSEVQQAIDDLVDTMRDASLIGESAPQIGKSLRIFVTEVRATKYRKEDVKSELRIYINPEITSVSKDQAVGYEGCGSILRAQLFGPVKRPKKVKVKAQDRKGKEFVLEADGLLARVIQHEYDHLDGILFTDKIDDWTKIMAQEEYLKMKKKNT